MNDFKGWIEPIKGLRANVAKLLEEFKSEIADKLTDVTGTNAVLVQRKYHLMFRDEFDTEKTDLSKLPFTMEIFEKVRPLLIFNSVNYRLVMPNTAYNWHVDTGKNCIHVPLVTNRGCWFVYDNLCFRMPADGTVYLVNNERYHTFMNAGKIPRLHLTFELL